jgi:hypothetical protein
VPFWNPSKLSVGVPKLAREIPKLKSSVPRLGSRRLRVLLISIFNVLAVLAVTELLLSILDLKQVRLGPSDIRHGYHHDPDLGWIEPANSVGHVNARPDRSACVITASVRGSVTGAWPLLPKRCVGIAASEFFGRPSVRIIIEGDRPPE